MLPLLSEAKRDYISRSDLSKVNKCIPYKLKNKLPVAHASRFIPFTLTLQGILLAIV